MTITARDALSAYVSGYEALVSHIYTLFDAYKHVYEALAMETPERYKGVVTPTVANYDGLTGTVLLSDDTRVGLWELENPEFAAGVLHDKLAIDIERQADALIRVRTAQDR